jgi:hypothetical protein
MQLIMAETAHVCSSPGMQLTAGASTKTARLRFMGALAVTAMGTALNKRGFAILATHIVVLIITHSPL